MNNSKARLLPALLILALVRCGGGGGGGSGGSSTPPPPPSKPPSGPTRVARPKIVISPDPVPTTLPLHIETLYITQESQRLDRSVPLVQGRPGVLRVFVLANTPVHPAPAVRVRMLDASGTVLGEQDIPGPAAGVPQKIDEAVLDNAWNMKIDGDFLRPGVSLTAEIVAPPLGVPTGSLTYPPDGRPLSLNVVRTPPLDLVLVPIRTAAGVGQILGPKRTLALWTELLRRYYPLERVNVTVGAEFQTGWDPKVDSQQTHLLNDLEAARVATGRHDRTYFYGVFPMAGDLPGRGLAPLLLSSSSRTAVGWDNMDPRRPRSLFPIVLVHEVGHNFGLNHAPCGEDEFPQDVDPEFPYKQGEIGACGFDVTAGRPLHPTQTKDVMSYCHPQWSSDYDCRFILDFRAGDLVSAPTAAPEEDCLLVQGTIRDGRAELEPAFSVHRAPLPPTGGEYQLSARDRTGKVLASEAFQPAEVGDAAEGDRRLAFTLVLPLDQAGQKAMTTLRVTREGETLGERRAAGPAPGGGPQAHAVHGRHGQAHLTWDVKDYPEAMVKDSRGDVVAMGEAGKLDLAVPGKDLDVLFSDGLHTVEEDVKIQ